ncbi:TerD family protein [Bacillus velezensis]|uniref:TerD family protein n=1 Tax=Bacillus velezensis TaxID=492670 RepID=UPI001A91EA8E|nr:TerD family protein [Bacillus velezensis]BCT30445.1 chemical-damaging agent resistance protein C [Bacillus velezensis]
MTVNLLKAGQSIDLTKANAGLKNVTLGLRWGALVNKSPEQRKEKTGILSRFFKGAQFTYKSAFEVPAVDVDSAVILVNEDGQKIDRIYYANRRCRGVLHAGDDLTGNDQYGEEDNEEIYINLQNLRSDVKEIYVVANIFSGANDFSSSRLRGSYVRLLNSDSKEELVRYELDEFKGMRGVILGKLYRSKNEWSFKALGKGVKTGSISSIESSILHDIK